MAISVFFALLCLAGYSSGLRLEIEGQRDVRTRHGLLRGRNIDGTAVLNNTKDVDTLQFSIFGKSLVVAAAKHCTATVSRTTFRMISALQCPICVWYHPALIGEVLFSKFAPVTTMD